MSKISIALYTVSGVHRYPGTKEGLKQAADYYHDLKRMEVSNPFFLKATGIIPAGSSREGVCIGDFAAHGFIYKRHNGQNIEWEVTEAIHVTDDLGRDWLPSESHIWEK